jgi:membrane protein
LLRAAGIAAGAYRLHRCKRFAAAISYHFLLSLFPLAVALVATIGLVLQDDEVRADVVSEILARLPLTEDAGVDLDRAITELDGPLGSFALVGIATLVWAASGMMGAIRDSLNVAWRAPLPHPFLRGKLLDLVMVIAISGIVVASAGIAVAQRLVPDLSLSSPAGIGIGIATPVLIVFGGLVALYRFVPATTVRTRDVLAGAATATLALRLLQEGFAVYVSRFSDYNVVYGSLGTVIASLILVYLAASVMLFGAEMAAAWPEAAREPLPGTRTEGGWRGWLRQRVRGLV